MFETTGTFKKVKKKRRTNIWNKTLSKNEFNEMGKFEQLLDSNSYDLYSIHRRYFVLKKRIEKGSIIINNTSMIFSNSKCEFNKLCEDYNLPNPWLNQ